MLTPNTLTGPAAIEQLFRETLDAMTPLLRTALAGAPLVYAAGDDFSEWFLRERRARGIHVRSLRFGSGAVDRPAHTNYADLDKEVRTAPSGIQSDVSLVLWDDNVAIVTTEPTIEIVWHRDKAYATTLQSWYDCIWNQSNA